jgi:hypothetical protein
MFKIFVGSPTTRVGAWKYKKQPGRLHTIFQHQFLDNGLGHKITNQHRGLERKKAPVDGNIHCDYGILSLWL